MIKFEKDNSGMFATQYSIYEDDIYIGEVIGYVEELCTNKFMHITTWCFFKKPEGDLTEFINKYREIIEDDIELKLKDEYENYDIWDYDIKIIVEGEVINFEI